MHYLGVGPRSIKIRIGKEPLREKVLDLMNNPAYKEKAAALGEKISSEKGIEGMCEFIENFVK